MKKNINHSQTSSSQVDNAQESNVQIASNEPSDTKNLTMAAPLWRRFASMLYDSFLLVAISMAYGTITLLIHIGFNGVGEKDYSPMVEGTLFQVGWLASIAIFYCYFWSKAGQTAGMKAWRIKVIDSDGNLPNITTCAKRYLLSLLSFLTLGAGYFWSLIDKQGRTLHDRFSNTHTVYLPKNKSPKS